MSNIPKIIHQIWVGPNPIPAKSIKFIEGIKQLHAEFEYRLWTNTDITPENFVNYSYILRSKSYAQKADIMRYEILYRHGGVYLDVDFELFKNITPLLNNDLIVCNEDANIDKYMSIGFIASTKNNIELKNCIESVKNINFSSTHISNASGPWFFRRCIKLTDKVTVIPTSYMYPTHYSNKTAVFTINDTTYGHHHWDKNW